MARPKSAKTYQKEIEDLKYAVARKEDAREYWEQSANEARDALQVARDALHGETKARAAAQNELNQSCLFKEQLQKDNLGLLNKIRVQDKVIAKLVDL